MKNSKKVAIYGLFIALTYIATNINIPRPDSDGMFHLGTIVTFTIAIVWGKNVGSVSAAIGMGLFDLLSQYAVWTPFTFIIRLLSGYILGLLANPKNEKSKFKKGVYLGLGLILSTVIIVGGYYIAGLIIFGNNVAPLKAIISNIVQCVVSAIGAIPLSLALKTSFKSRNIDLSI